VLGEPEEPGAAPPYLAGSRVLVVVARPAQIAHWRALVERCAGKLLHHDGGVDDNISSLGGLVSRADLILFPADADRKPSPSAGRCTRSCRRGPRMAQADKTRPPSCDRS
jgi:hypothetical protein